MVRKFFSKAHYYVCTIQNTLNEFIWSEIKSYNEDIFTYDEGGKFEIMTLPFKNEKIAKQKKKEEKQCIKMM